MNPYGMFWGRPYGSFMWWRPFWWYPIWWRPLYWLPWTMMIKLGHHKDIGRTIEQWQRNGWRLHTYQAQGTPTLVNHYLLFERDINKKPSSAETAAIAAAAASAT